MLRNYFKTAFRNLMRQRGSALLNIAGLSLGITCSIILFLLVTHLLSFDKFQSKFDRIYRVVTESDGNDGRDYQEGIPSPLPVAFRGDFPEAEAVAFTSYRAGSLVMIPQKNGEPKKYSEEAGVVFTEPTIFKIFDRAIVIGDPGKGLDEPNEAVISKSWAVKYFGKEDAIGEIVTYNKKEYKITAVVEDHGTNTDFPFDLYLSYETIRRETEEHGWNSIWSDEHCYFLLKENVDIGTVSARMPDFAKKYLGDRNFSNETFTIQPLSTIHYDERYGAYSYNTVEKSIIFTLGVIGLFLLLTACVNFINLATAEAIKRSKEVGVRKTLGSSRSQLIAQFLGETSLVTLISIIISICLAQVAISFLNPFLDLELTMSFAKNLALPLYLTGVFVCVSLLSGLYPAMVLSGFKPALALKSKIAGPSSSGYLLRKGLVVFQFFISQLFIIGTIVIISQMNYARNKELGFRRDAIISVPIPENENPAYEDSTGQGSKMRTLATEISRIAGVEKVSLNSATPSSGNVSGTGFVLEGETDDKRKDTQVKQVDGNYVDLFELTLLAGENIQDLDTAKGFVVNERFMNVSGFTDPKEFVGKRVRIWGKRLPVVGVVKDFHATSLREQIEPLAMFNRIRGYELLSMKINAQSYQTSIDEVKKLWEAAYPQHIFEYTFLDEQIKEFYEGEAKMSALLSIFSSMAIFIGCLGLFGLATFMANQKTKEIGVRKVMGASVENILMMFSKEFMILIVIGFVFAGPLAWWAMSQFLNQFAFKIDLGAWIFLAGIGSTLVLALITVGYKSFRAATANPVKSLRYE